MRFCSLIIVVLSGGFLDAASSSVVAKVGVIPEGCFLHTQVFETYRWQSEHPTHFRCLGSNLELKADDSIVLDYIKGKAKRHYKKVHGVLLVREAGKKDAVYGKKISAMYYCIQFGFEI